MKQAVRIHRAHPAPQSSKLRGVPARPMAGPNSHLIDLQRQIGNRQLSRLLEAPPAETGGIQRKIATTSVSLAVWQNRKDKMKTMLGASTTLGRLVAALRDYEASKDPARTKALVTLLIGLSGHWLEKYGKTKGLLKSRVEDLEAEAQTELGRLKAMDKYLDDVKTGGVDALSQMSTDHALPEAAQLASGKAGGTAGTTAGAVDMVKKYGLTEAEVAAIKIYTASDYLYINPATSNSPGWMGAQQGKISEKATQQVPRTQKDLIQQGALHAGAMMQAFSKLPRLVTTTYRGSRESEASFKAKYLEKKNMTFGAFGSSASTQEPADNFAQGKGESPPLPDQSIHVMCVLKVTNGRQVEGLSIYGAGEREVLLMPGAEFNISRVEKHAKGPAGNVPFATAWYTVHMEQVK